MTIEGFQDFLANPLVLLAAMYAAMASSMLKQIVAARRDGLKVPGVTDYLVTYWPETAFAIFGNAIAFATLVETGTLNLASAVGIGYATNSVADLIRAGGRSSAIAGMSDVAANPKP